MDFSQSNFVKQAEELNQEKQQKELYRQKYQVDAPIEVYSMFENIVANSENPEEEIYRLGTAYTFSENLGIEIGEAYTNLDSYSEAVYGKPVESYKGFFPNLRDSFYIGRVNRDIASLGNKIRASELAGNTDMLEDLYKELEAYKNEINVRRQGTKQEGFTNAFNQVAESLPYMLDAIAVGALGNIVAPGLGTLATGLLGTDYYSGQEYLDLRKQGASVEGANKASLISGGIQAILEQILGSVAGAIVDIAGGTTAAKSISKKVGDALKKSPAWKKVLSNAARYGGNATEEGIEEVLQEATSLITETVLAKSEGYKLKRESISKTLWENFKGGFTGSLILGGLPLTVNTVATASDYKKIREMAINIESEEMFKKAVKDSVVFNGMEENKKTETIKNIWDTYQSQRDEAFNQKVKEQAEVTDKASGYDTEIDAEYREEGRLYTEDRQLEDGKNTFVIGNPEKEGSNLYGHIDYSVDGDTITIENFKMNETREALRNEFFQEFAEQHPGMKIEWETVGQVATDIKNELIANNPYGKENGLNYYKDEQSVVDARTRRKVADEIGKHFKFDTKQKSAAVFVLEAMANSQGRNLTEYVQNTFGENIIGENAEIEAMANRQNQTFQGKAGATTFSKDMKAVIYAGEKADFSTWVHELSHVYQRQLSGDLLTQAEKAFNVQNGDWSTSSYTFKNSKGQNVTYSSEEAFAYGFQDWLQTGKAPNQELKNIFEQFAEFLARCYNALKNHLNLSKDVVDVYNQLLKGDNSMLALAERAVIENDKKRLADERVKQEEAKLEQENKLKEEKAEIQAQKEENLEVTDFEEVETVEETEDTQLKEDVSEEEKAVFLAGTEEAKKVYETLDDTSETKEVKDNTIINTAIEQKQEIDMLFQMVGEESIKRMAESAYKRELLSNLEKAKNFYNGIYKNLEPKIRALRLKIQTGWEYDSKAGKWKYETDDSIAKFNWEGRFAEVFKLAPKNLVETLNARNITIGDMIVHEELFSIFPWLKMANVKFTNRLDTLVTSLTDEGILINLAHVKDADIKKTLGHQMQHLIQGVEHSNSGFTGNNFKKLYSTLNKAVNDTVTEEEINDIDQLSKDYFNNEGEIEARRVAERYTMISNERNSNPINFQVIGSEGAAQLDLTEEVTTRMDNLNIAMHMEENGNTPKEIRLATGWEKGADGQWKYEIDDAYNVDFEYKAIDFVKNNPRFTELENKLAEGEYNWDNLTEEEQKEFDKLSDEFNKGYYTNETTLKEIIDAQELFKAYPQLKDMKVTFEYKPGEKRGTYRNGKIVDEFFEIEETFNDIVIYTLPNSENKEYIKTILIHEIQHAIQDIEGFAKGGNKDNFDIIGGDIESDIELYQELILQKQDYIDTDFYKKRIEKLKAEKEELEKKGILGKVDVSEYMIANLMKEADAIFNKQSKEWQILARQFNEADINNEHETARKIFEKIEEIDPDDNFYDYLVLKANAKSIKKERRFLSPYNAYYSLAGEAEARNVQERYRLFKANQQARRESLLADTQDVPSNEQIILFQEEQDVRNQYENTDKWLKAPNGNDTNLTEKQWLQVRTPSFKKWFGDWENDPENASKVVDENGEPLVVYHGSNHWFNIFNEGKTNKTNVNTPENTIFTNDNKEIASSFHNYYGGAISDVILDKDSPLHRKYDWGTYRAGGVYSLFMNLRNPKILDYKGQNWNVEGMNINDEVAKALKEGYDGFIAKNIIDVGFTDVTPPISNDYIAFNNTDVKSATDNSGEFNADNPSILFQTAYHGTPHNFDKFSTSAIGTGEGAQSFGWGLYFTNQEDIARWYADKLTNTEKKEEYIRKIEELEKEVQSLKVIVDVYKTKLKENNLSKRIKSNIETALPDFLKKIESKETSIKLLKETLNKQNKRNLYTVELPDNGYLLWDKEYEAKDLTSLKQPLFNRLLDEYFGGDKESTQYEVDSIFYDGITGEEFYHSLQHELGSDKAASLFLKENGYIGIDYPANSLGGHTDEGKRNYVIFDENDVTITSHILFQTEGELLEEARSFDTWEEWRDYVETFKNDFDYEQVPSNADDTFYRTTWELANREPQGPVNKDETFIDYILNRDNLKDFLAEIGSIDTIDIWQPMDEEEAREIEMLQNKKDIINTKLAQWKGFGRSVLYGNELKESTYKNLETQIKNKPRDFREIFTEIMNNQQFAVAEDEKTTTQLQKKYRLSDVEVNEIENSSPEKRRQIARELSNKDIAERVKNGTLEMGDELYDYIDTLNKEIKTLQDQYDSLEKEVAEDYQRISNWEDRELLRLHDQLLEAKEEYELKSDEVAKKIERGIRVTKKYKDASLRAKATYDTVFKKFNDLAKSYEASITAKEAMTRKEKITDIKKKLRQKQEEKRLSQELKKIRTQLIKRTMRKVKFDTVNYDQAKQIIAIQNLFEPNLLGGVNKWIGTEGDTLRNVYSKWNTDNEYKEKMMRKLAGKYDVIDLLNETDTIEKYNSWTKEQRAMMYRALPKKDWIEELNLEELARERSETFHLDIGTRTISQWVEVDGKKELVTMDIPVLSEELETLVKNALGETLYNQVVYRQFAEWTTDEMEQLAKRVNELYKEGRDELNNKALVRKQEAQEIRNAIERAVKDTGIVINDDDSEEVKQKKLKKIAKILGDDPTLKGTSAKKRTSKWQRLLEGYGDARLLSVARLLDNNKDGVNVSELYRKEDDCYNARERKIAERTQKINKSMADNKITLKDLYSTVTIKDWYKGESATFTIDELLFMAKAAEDEQSKQAVMFGNLFSSEKMLQEKEDLERGDMLYRYEEICYNLYEKVLAEVRKLPSKYLDFADSISADYAEQYERMNKTSIEEFNQPVNRVENYVPIVRLESNGDTNENRVIDDFMAGHGLSKKGVDKGMTKSRVKIGAFHQKPIELGLYKTWADSVQRTEHFIAYAPYVRELNRVYKNQEANLTRQFIENRYGKGMLNYIDSYIAEVANPNANVQKSQLDNLVRTLRGKTAPAYLAWKTSSIIKQLITSPTPFFQFTSPINYLKASLDCIQPSMHDAIKEKSIFMRNRKFDPIQDLIKEQEEKNTNKIEAGINKFNAIGMQGLEYIDWACVAPGWLACYRSKLAEVQKEKQKIFDAEYFKTNDKKLAQEKANQIAEEIAVTYADDCVRQCQPSNRKVDIAPLFKESSEVAKAYLQFQTSLNVIWNNLRYDLPYAVKNRQFAKIVGMISGYVVAGLGVNLMCSWFDDDDDELDKIKKSIFYATTQFTDAVPVLGSSLTKLSEKLITGESGYSMGTDLTPMVTKFMQGVQAIPKAKESGEWEDWQKVCGKFGEAIGLTLGLPVSGTKEILEVIEEQSITPLIGR